MLAFLLGGLFYVRVSVILAGGYKNEKVTERKETNP